MDRPAAVHAEQIARVRLGGDVERARVLTVPELRTLPQRTIEAAFGCRRVGAQRHLFEAVPLLDVAVAAGPRFDPDLAKDRLRYLLAVSGRDGHCAVFSWGEIDPGYGGGEALLATSMDGVPLDEAGPHLVVPRDRAGGRYISQVASIWVGPAADLLRVFASEQAAARDEGVRR
jgi:hypothetical protein